MSASEAFVFGVEHAADQVISYLERNGHNQAEIRLYREMAKQAREIAPAIAKGGQDAFKLALPILATFGEAMKQYLADTMADNFESRALAPGAAAAAAARMYDALGHLISVIDEEHHWAWWSPYWPLWSLKWYERGRRVTPSDFAAHLDGLSAALGDVARATHDADCDLRGAHRLSHYLIEAQEPSAAQIANISESDGIGRTLAIQPERGNNNGTVPSTVDLRDAYIQVLTDTRNRASDIQRMLEKRDHPAGGASTYTVRDQVCRAEALVCLATIEIAALRRTIRPTNLRVVDAK